MEVARASAPGKVILFGEHAVVYGQPALAVPVTQVHAMATVEPAPDNACWIDARDLGQRYRFSEAAPDDALAAAARLTLEQLTDSGRRTAGDQGPWTIIVESTIPIASGLGSGAAVCTAIVRALSAYLGQPLSDAEVSAIVLETEKLLHGTPSGIDNTVVAYGRPVYFVKGRPPMPLAVAFAFRLLIGDTGLPSPTRATVGDVRAAHEREPERYGRLFAEIGAIVTEARALIESETRSVLKRLGVLMNRNQELLQQIGVSSAELESLIRAARDAGALGAKLSGGGRGGNMLALVTPQSEATVRAALERAGATRVIGTNVGL